MLNAKSKSKRREKPSSMSAAKIAIMTTVISVLTASTSSYLVTRTQTKTLRSAKWDELAHELTKLELERMTKHGVSNDYSVIANYAVLRRLVEDASKARAMPLEELRDSVEVPYARVCQTNRKALLTIMLAHSDYQRLQEATRSLRDDTEKWANHLLSKIETAKSEQEKRLLQSYADSEKRRVRILNDLLWEGGQRRDLSLEALQKEIKEDEESQFRD